MKLFILTLLLGMMCACSQQNTHQRQQEPPKLSSPRNGNAIHDIKVGDDLHPYIGLKVKIKGKVSQTKYPSFGSYWITAFGLEQYRGKTVTVSGTVSQQQKSTQGGQLQGRDGTFYHLGNIKVISSGNL